MLRWLRESSGWGIDEISGRLNTTPAVIRDLESGIRSPTLVQLEKMSASYRYPLAAFFLSKPKKQKPLPKDYRFLPGGGRGVFDKKTLIAIRRSRRLQNLGRELSSNYQTHPTHHSFCCACGICLVSLLCIHCLNIYRMTRSVQKGPFVDYKLLKKVAGKKPQCILRP